MRLRTAHHALPPPVLDNCLRCLRTGTVETIKRSRCEVAINKTASDGPRPLPATRRIPLSEGRPDLLRSSASAPQGRRRNGPCRGRRWSGRIARGRAGHARSCKGPPAHEGIIDHRLTMTTGPWSPGWCPRAIRMPAAAGRAFSWGIRWRIPQERRSVTGESVHQVERVRRAKAGDRVPAGCRRVARDVRVGLVVAVGHVVEIGAVVGP